MFPSSNRKQPGAPSKNQGGQPSNNAIPTSLGSTEEQGTILQRGEATGDMGEYDRGTAKGKETK